LYALPEIFERKYGGFHLRFAEISTRIRFMEARYTVTVFNLDPERRIQNIERN